MPVGARHPDPAPQRTFVGVGPDGARAGVDAPIGATPAPLWLWRTASFIDTYVPTFATTMPIAVIDNPGGDAEYLVERLMIGTQASPTYPRDIVVMIGPDMTDVLGAGRDGLSAATTSIVTSADAQPLRMGSTDKLGVALIGTPDPAGGFTRLGAQLRVLSR